jgi:hypothetical protein
LENPHPPFTSGVFGVNADISSGSGLCDVPRVTQPPWPKRAAALSAATKTRRLRNEVTAAPKYGPGFGNELLVITNAANQIAGPGY